MHRLHIKVPSEVLELVNVIQHTLGAEFEVTLAGGFLRDSYGGAAIKDIDIIVTPVKEMEDPTSRVTTLVDLGYIQDWFYSSKVVPANYIETMASRGVHGLIMGQCPNLGNFECQLIVYGKPMSRPEVAADMDLNICQVIMGPDGEVWATSSFIYGFQYGVISVLNGQSDEREAERIERMLKKYPDFVDITNH